MPTQFDTFIYRRPNDYLRSLALALQLSSPRLFCSFALQRSRADESAWLSQRKALSPFPSIKKVYECEVSGETQACHLLPSLLARCEPSLTEDILDHCLRCAVELIFIEKILLYSWARGHCTASAGADDTLGLTSPARFLAAWPHELEIGPPGYCGPAEKEAMGRGLINTRTMAAPPHCPLLRL